MGRFPACRVFLLGAVLLSAGRAQGPGLALPQAVILKGPQPGGELGLRAYANSFAAVALPWRIVQADGLEARATYNLNSPTQREELLLVVPAATARSLTAAQRQAVLDRVGRGAVLVTEGITPLSEKLGFRAASTVEVRQIVETAYPALRIVWQRPERVTTIEPPVAATVLTREKQTGAPLAALLPHGSGHCLVLAAQLDPVQGEGYARFPYFLHALRRAGVRFPFRSDRLSAFFDYGYRYSADVEALAVGWRRAGIQALHVSAWHFYEPNADRHDYLRRLIAACHRQGILVYAWLELPHVSEAFYKNHPQWREKNAARLDARFDWRLLVNLKDPDCFRAVTHGLRRLLQAFDWDGVNLGELYFESPYGPESPGHFTPFNDLVRAEFQARHGVDPLDLFRQNSPHYWRKDVGAWIHFVNYRVEQLRILHERFLQFFTELRVGKRSHLDLVITYVDSLFDPTMRQAVGVDIGEMLPLMDRYDFRLVVEDSYALWHLPPRRYSGLGQSYSRLLRHSERLGVDINIVEREIGWPTRKQTGVELAQLFHHAAKNFPTVLVYSEQSILEQDLELMPHALAAGVSAEISGEAIAVKTPHPVSYQTGLWAAGFRVNGKLWPCGAEDVVLLPAGAHRVTAAPPSGKSPSLPRLVRLAGELLDAQYESARTIRFSYRSRARAIAVFDRAPRTVTVDGRSLAAYPTMLLPPGGPHVVRVRF